MEVEDKARKFGWVPKEEFRGEETSWVDAETFVKRGDEINPILRANNERLLKEISESNSKHQQELAELRQAAEEFKQFQKDSFDKKKSSLEKEIQSLKEQRKTAIKEGDGDLVVELEDRIEELNEEKAEAPKVTAPEKKEESDVALDPDLSNWITENKWFGADRVATETANDIGIVIAKENPNLKGKAFLAKLDERLKKVLPELYENPNQRQSPVEGTTGSKRSSGGKKTFEDLPQDAQIACDKFIKQKLFKSREEYLSMYDWE